MRDGGGKVKSMASAETSALLQRGPQRRRDSGNQPDGCVTDDQRLHRQVRETFENTSALHRDSHFPMTEKQESHKLHEHARIPLWGSA